jgi:hypothetical protein
MKYHDNEVKFSFITKNFNKACRILGGSYIIEQRAITSGQDPDDKNTPGLRKTLNSKGEILFRVGRKKSVSVANWFNNFQSLCRGIKFCVYRDSAADNNRWNSGG